MVESGVWVTANRSVSFCVNMTIKTKTSFKHYSVSTGADSTCCIYETEWQTCLYDDFITPKATFEKLNCGAMKLNQAYIVIHLHNGSWWLTCKCTAEQSNSLIKSCTAIISYTLFFTLDFFLCIKSCNTWAHYVQSCSLFQLSED